MRFLSRIAPALALVLALCGCGGGGSGGPSTTRVVLNVDWPTRSRNIGATSSALSLKVVLQAANSDGSDFSWVVNREANAAAHTSKYTAPTAVKTGAHQLTFQLFAQADAQGDVVGTASALVTIRPDGSGIDTLNIGGVVASVQVPTGQMVSPGATKDLVFTTRDAANNIVAVTPGSAIWHVTTGADKIRFTNGQAVGLVVGDANVTATVDGKASSAVSVHCGSYTGSIAVTVRDRFNSLVPGAQISVYQNSQLVTQVTSTTGQSTIASVPLGSADVRVSKSGFTDNQATVNIQDSQTAATTITLQDSGLPSATTVATRVISVSGNQMVFETDIAVADAGGSPIHSLAPGTFTIADFAKNSVTYGFSAPPTSTEVSRPYVGPYSAFIAMDSSGSVKDSDPAGTRVQAAKAFFAALGNGDNAMFGYFPDANFSDKLYAYTNIGFVTNGSVYYQYIDTAGSLGLYGTPIYNAIKSAAQIASTSGTNARKAVVVISDAKSAYEQTALNDAVTTANAQGVQIHMVGVGTSIDTRALSELAARTGGSTILATDARQLLSFYKTLGALLEGAGDFYRLRWTVTLSSGTWTSGTTLNSNVSVALPGITLTAPFFVSAP